MIKTLILITFVTLVEKCSSTECHVCSVGEGNCGSSSPTCNGEWCVSIWVNDILWSSGCITGYDQVWKGCFEISKENTICACQNRPFCSDSLPPNDLIYHVVPTVVCHNEYGRVSPLMESQCEGSACFMGALRKWTKEGNETLKTEFQHCLHDPVPALQAYVTTIPGLADLDTCYRLKMQMNDNLYDQYSCVCTSNLCNSHVMREPSLGVNTKSVRCQVSSCIGDTPCVTSAYCSGEVCIYMQRVTSVPIVDDYVIENFHTIKGCVQSSGEDSIKPKHARLQIGTRSVYEAWYCADDECNENVESATQSLMKYQLYNLDNP